MVESTVQEKGLMDYRGKSILVVGGGLLQVPAVEIAHSMGLRIAVTDRNPGCICASLADRFYPLDTKDVVGHTELACKLKRDWNLAAVFTEGASVEVTVAAAAHAAGLPGIPPEVARRIANKAQMRQTLSKMMPMKLGYYKTFDDAWQGTSGSPMFVVKSEDNSGSRGLTKVARHDDFTQAMFNRAQISSSTDRVLVEELLHPNPNEEFTEQSVETVWYNSEGHFLNWVDRPFLNHALYAIERGHLNPAQHSAQTQQQVEQMVLAAGRALGMTTGIFKCDVMLTTKGPRILETTARLSGGFDAQYTSPLAHGTSYIRGAMKLALGEPIDWNDFLPRQYRHAVALSAFPNPGRITAINGIEEAMRIPGVERIFSRSEIGSVIEPYTTCVERPLFVIASGDSRKEAVDAAEKALGTIRIETETR